MIEVAGGVVAIHQGDALTVLRTLPSVSVQTCVTSPPYWGLRDYGVNGQLGLEQTPEEYVERLVDVFSEIRRVLKDDGTLWLNLGDSYASTTSGFGKRGGTYESERAGWGDMEPAHTEIPFGLKPKDLVGIPWRVAFALQSDDWYLRSDIIWAKPNPMPESVTDRPTKSHEYLFLLSKSSRYYYDADAIAERGAGRLDLGRMKRPEARLGEGGGWKLDGLYRKDAIRNKRTVWTIATEPYSDAHFATFPEALVKPCILAGCPEGGTVLDPFAGSGTTLKVARDLGRRGVGIELNPEYVALAMRRVGPQMVLQP